MTSDIIHGVRRNNPPDHEDKGKEREMKGFKRLEDGTYEETTNNITARISDRFGFMRSRIVMMEGSYDPLQVSGKTFRECVSCSFQVNGLGWSTDFYSVTRDEAYDA